MLGVNDEPRLKSILFFCRGVDSAGEAEFKKKLDRKSSFVEEKAANQTSARPEGQSVGDEQALCSRVTPLLMVAAHSNPCTDFGRVVSL